MRAAYVNADPGVPLFGTKGCSIHVQEVLRALHRRGIEWQVFAVRSEGECPPDLADITVHRLPLATYADQTSREQCALALNAHTAASLSKHTLDWVYERYSLWSYAAMEHARSRKIPGLLEVNAPLIEEQAKHRRLTNRKAAEEAARRAFGAAGHILAVSHEVAAYLKGWPEARGKVEVVPNGVDPARFGPTVKPALAKPHGAFVIVFTGSLKPWHGLSELVEAFDQLQQQVPDAQLLIIGDGPERESMQKNLRERSLLSASHFTGAVPPVSIPGLLASADVAVAPYPKLDGFYFSPLKVYEYMAAGLPVVASDIGQLRTLLRDEATGLLVNAGDSTALARTLCRLAREPESRQRLGAAARNQVLQHHTWDAVAVRILQMVARQPVGALV